MTTPVFDAGSQGFTSGAASLTISHTVGSGSDRALVVWATCINSTDFLASATVTYGGVSMGSPAVTPAGGTSNNYVYCWVLVNPASGTANVVITPSASAYIKAICSSWHTVDQTTPVAATNKAVTSFAGSPYSNSISATGHMAVDFLCLRNPTKTLTPDGTQTCIGTQIAGTLSSISGSYKSGATSMSWTQPDPGTAPIAWAAIALAGTTPAAQLTGTITLDDFVLSGAFATGALSQLSGGITLDSFLLSGVMGLAPGRIDTNPFQNWTGTLLPGITVPNVVFIKLDRTTPLALTNQATAGDGVMTIQNAALVTGTRYVMVSFNADGSQLGAELVEAT